MLRHPVVHFKQQGAFIFQALVKTYLELDTIYWIDAFTSQSRVRLTNTVTGEYVIYGRLGEHADVGDIGIDEYLKCIVPARRVRVKLGHNTFTSMVLNDDVYYYGVLGKYGIEISLVDGAPISSLVEVSETVRTQARLAQYVILDTELRLQ